MTECSLIEVSRPLIMTESFQLLEWTAFVGTSIPPGKDSVQAFHSSGAKSLSFLSSAILQLRLYYEIQGFVALETLDKEVY